ncbi:MAG: tetratricopeptide repeat family protein [Micavibrio sp.]|nr:tetratricopeptide repeat family protein [Micavibrio sp.]
MSHKKSARFLVSVAALAIIAAGCGHLYAAGNAAKDVAAASAVIEPAAGDEFTFNKSSVRRTLAGEYLTSRYAQSKNNWGKATPLLDALLEKEPDNKELLRQSMVIAEGSGNHDLAAKRAQKLVDLKSDDGLARLIVATHAIGKGDYDTAIKTLTALPKGDMADFVMPLLKGWAMAGKGQFTPEMFKGTTIHAYHGGVIAHYLKKDNALVFGFAETILAPSGLTGEEVERAADLMAISGHPKDAVNVYKALQSQKGGSDLLEEKIAAADKGGDMAKLIPALAVKTPAEGAATAILDLARILYLENSDASSRIFAQMALDLDPNKVETHILIASSYARSKQFDQALAEYNKIPESRPEYLTTRHEAAEILADSGKTDEAVALLNKLYATHHNPDSLIRIGDIYRSKEDFSKALAVYNDVAAKLPNPVPEEYWYLLYARGMTEERLKDWPKAEADLKKALEYQPDHPYIMNYLGYAWIDQGIHMDEAMKMLESASALRPNDGYITDSLGWAHFKMKQFAEAVPLLEQAVGMLPYDSEINSHLGDAYWQVGRKVEARFQWERARNYAKDTKLTDALNAKMENGMTLEDPAKPVAAAAATPAVPPVTSSH